MNLTIQASTDDMSAKDPMRGPGRPPLPPDEEQKRRNINLDDDRAAFAARIGDGNLSRGLRRLIDDARQAEEVAAAASARAGRAAAQRKTSGNG